MKVLVTGASGRVGRACWMRLAQAHGVLGLDQAPSSTADVVASIEDAVRLREALRGMDAVVHVAGLHAPQVGHHSAAAFDAVNVRATGQLARLAAEAGVRRFVFTSTTALYGAQASADGAAWVDEDTPPVPRSVYHHSKLQAEAVLAEVAAETGLSVIVLRMSRCFPEPAPLMAAYRLHRGIDVRDVADAHACAVEAAVDGAQIRRYVVSGATPFLPDDRPALLAAAGPVIAQRCPELAEAFERRGWRLPTTIDRVYVSDRAARELGWRPRHGFDEVLAQLDRRSLEVLPPRRQGAVSV